MHEDNPQELGQLPLLEEFTAIDDGVLHGVPGPAGCSGGASGIIRGELPRVGHIPLNNCTHVLSRNRTITQQLRFLCNRWRQRGHKSRVVTCNRTQHS